MASASRGQRCPQGASLLQDLRNVHRQIELLNFRLELRGVLNRLVEGLAARLNLQVRNLGALHVIRLVLQGRRREGPTNLEFITIQNEALNTNKNTYSSFSDSNIYNKSKLECV